MNQGVGDRKSLRERLEASGLSADSEPLQFDVLLPPRALSPNRKGGYWVVRLAPTREYRREVGMLALSARRKQLWNYEAYRKPRVFLTFNVVALQGDGRYRPRDEDNAVASFKAGFDGMTDAGVWPDDSMMIVAGVTILRDKSELPGVTVKVYYELSAS